MAIFKLWKLILLEFVLVMPQFCNGQEDPEPPTVQALSAASAAQGVPVGEPAVQPKVAAIAKESPAPAKSGPVQPGAGTSLPAPTEPPATQGIATAPIAQVMPNATSAGVKSPAAGKESLKEKKAVAPIKTQPGAKPEPKKPITGKEPAPKAGAPISAPIKAAVVKKAKAVSAPGIPSALPSEKKVQKLKQPTSEKSKEKPKFEKLQYVPTLEEKNKEADRAFIEWKISDPYSGLSLKLRQALTPDAIGYIVEEAEVPFTGVLNEDELEQHVATVTDNFIKTFDPEGRRELNRRELFALLKEVVEPQHVFQMKRKPTYFLDKLYNSFLKVLQEHITPINTTLQEWALRFLTADSILVALPIIEAVDVDGKSFSQLTPQEKKLELQRAVDLITQRFLTNLAPVQEKFSIQVPGRMDEAIKYKITKFLQEKFISILD